MPAVGSVFLGQQTDLGQTRIPPVWGLFDPMQPDQQRRRAPVPTQFGWRSACCWVCLHGHRGVAFVYFPSGAGSPLPRVPVCSPGCVPLQPCGTPCSAPPARGRWRASGRLCSAPLHLSCLSQALISRFCPSSCAGERARGRSAACRGQPPTRFQRPAAGAGVRPSGAL